MKANSGFAGTILFLIFLGTFSLNAQTKKYSSDIEKKISQVENNLAGWVQKGTNDTWTLADRIKKI